MLQQSRIIPHSLFGEVAIVCGKLVGEGCQFFSIIIALYRQREPLPEGVSAQISDIAESLETRVLDLHNLAIKTPALATPYQEAARRLDSQAAERGMGLDRLKYWSESDPESSGSSTEGDNVTPDAQDAIERLEKELEKIKRKYRGGKG